MKEVNARMSFLLDVGLDYLTLGRSAGTLAGGEAQRIRLASQIGSGLVGVLYVLDEPSIGLHQRDNRRLIDTLMRLRDLGNTVLVVEHDEETIKVADWVVDIGPGAGEHGGEVIYSGPVKGLLKSKESITGQYVAGKRQIPTPQQRRPPGMEWLTIRGAREHNLKNIDVRLPLGCFVAVTGVSGSGKSTLIGDILLPSLMQKIYKTPHRAGPAQDGRGHRAARQGHRHRPVAHRPHAPVQPGHLHRRVRPHPAPLRHHAGGQGAGLPARAASRSTSAAGAARPARATAPSRSRCTSCPTSTCRARCARAPATTATRSTSPSRGRTSPRCSTCRSRRRCDFFGNQPAISRHMQTLVDVGLGYVRLGQPAPTLSGGEAQRVKLASELAKRSTGHTIYLLDEPTTGLHFEDVRKLLTVLSRLVDQGNTVLVIEHNLDVIKTADWVIDLGPEGGAGGGTVVAEGLARRTSSRCPASHTGRYLAPLLS